MAAKKEKKWECITKCYFNMCVYNPGDTVTGGDLSKNPNFKEMGTDEAAADDDNNGNGDGNTLPPA